MPTRGKPPSSKGQGKDEVKESAPGKSPMARFRAATIKVLNVSADAVKAEEKRLRERKKP